MKKHMIDTVKNSMVKNLNKFAFPLLIQFIASYFMGVSDTAIVARLSTESFNAVALVSSTLSMIAGVLGAITIALNIKLGKRLGEDDKKGFYFEFFTSVMLSLIIGIFFALIMLIGNRKILNLLYDLDGESLKQAVLYANPMSLYVVLQLLLFAFGTFFKVKNNTKWILLGSTTASIINLVIDYFFVLGKWGVPKLGVSMAGWSTVIALTVNLLIYILSANINLQYFRNPIKEYFRNIGLHVKESIVLILQEIIDGSLFTIGVNMIIIRVGKLEYAALAIIEALLGFLFIFKYIYGSAVISLTSISNSKKNNKEIFNYPKYANRISTLAYCVIAIVLVNQKLFFARLISNNVQALDIVSKFIIYFLIANICSSGAYVYQSALQAVGESRFVLYTTALVNLCTLIIMLILSIYFNLSLFGIAVAYFINETASNFIYKKKFVNDIL
ncbi:MATE family efflux transporter [Clostridium sp. ATCC 25772]|uniref:MATE family efflux transporter n=1 Tax=Clostridium sp. ATCC 25772 TaxID=1676991 RepID=UPI00078422D9|nr:MATE family efflux transporter [Clostridium sp. ATCC 25772]